MFSKRFEIDVNGKILEFLIYFTQDVIFDDKAKKEIDYVIFHQIMGYDGIQYDRKTVMKETENMQNILVQILEDFDEQSALEYASFVWDEHNGRFGK